MGCAPLDDLKKAETVRVDGEGFADLDAVRSHLMSQLGIADEFNKCVGKGLCIPRRHNEPGLTVLNDSPAI